MSLLSAAAADEDGDTIDGLRAENQQLRASLLATHNTLEMTARAGAAHAQAAEGLRATVLAWALRAERAEDMLEAIGAGGVGPLMPRKRKLTEQDIEDGALLGNIESPFNACMHQEHCKRWKAQADQQHQHQSKRDNDLATKTSHSATSGSTVPTGWILVPVVPTQAMLNAWQSHFGLIEGAYVAMLDAAPQPPVLKQPQVEHEPLTVQQIADAVVPLYPSRHQAAMNLENDIEIARAIERAHGIGGET